MTILKDNCYILTGAPGTGKTNLINELDSFFQTVKEPARELIKKHRTSSGSLWTKDREQFINLLMQSSVSDFTKASGKKITFFDRGIPDCVAYALYGDVAIDSLFNAATHYRYNEKVFLLAPWKDIYVNDEQRTMPYEETLKFHSQIVSVYTKLGYNIVTVPEGHVESRFDFIIKQMQTQL